MTKQKYSYLKISSTEILKTGNFLLYVNHTSDLTVQSPYSHDSDLTVQSLYKFCLREGTTKMTKYSNGSDENRPTRQSFFLKQCQKDLKYWKNNDIDKYTRILELIEETLENPFVGKGNPKPLSYIKYDGNKAFSRKIDDEHRLVYTVTNETVCFLQARYHYTK